MILKFKSKSGDDAITMDGGEGESGSWEDADNSIRAGEGEGKGEGVREGEGEGEGGWEKDGEGEEDAERAAGRDSGFNGCGGNWVSFCASRSAGLLAWV